MPLIKQIYASPDRKDPRFTVALIFYFFSLIVEFGALSFSLKGDFLNGFILHTIASLGMPWPLCHFMPRHFRTHFIILLFLFLLCFFIPLVSGICLFLSLTVTLYFTKPEEEDIFDYSEPDRFVKVTNDMLSKPDYCNGRIYGVIRFARDEEKRIKAVLSTSQLADEVAIPILRIALLDSVDEVRLLAYSMLDNKEKDIDSIIHQGLNQLKSNKLDHKTTRKTHHKLAEAYWELSYLGLVKGRAREHTLHSAKFHVEKALKLNPKGVGVLSLQVQILTALGYFKEANIALMRIKKQGISTEKLAARSAELAFELKRFSEVGGFVKKLDKRAENNMILDGMVKQWT